jgi:carbon storage regulator CsrA
VLETRDGRVRLGFEAPQGTPIHREEIFKRIAQAEISVPPESYRDVSIFYAECS